MNLKEIVGLNLKYFRYQSGLSQEKYYSSLNLNHKYLACIERGEENITSDYIDFLAKKIGVKREDLVLYNENHIITKKRIDEKATITH